MVNVTVTRILKVNFLNLIKCTFQICFWKKSWNWRLLRYWIHKWLMIYSTFVLTDPEIEKKKYSEKSENSVLYLSI